MIQETGGMYIGSLRSGRWSTADRSFAIRICLVLCDGAKPVLTEMVVGVVAAFGAAHAIRSLR